MRAFSVSLKSLVPLTLFVLGFTAKLALAAPFQEGGALPFSTDSLAWFDAGSTSSLYSDTACTAAASNNGVVACWKDLSGKNNHVVSVAGKGLPHLNQAGPANRSVVNFASANSETLEKILTTSTDYSLFVVMKPTKVKAQNPLFSNANSRTSQRRFFEVNATDEQMSFETDSNGPFAYAAQEQLWHVDAFSHNTQAAAETLSLWRDGALLSQKNLTVAGAPVRGQGAFFTRLRLNSNLAGDQYGDYQVAEMVIYNRALTSCEAREVSFFLATKYNFPFLHVSNYDLYSDYGYGLAKLMDLQASTSDPSGNVCANFLAKQASSSIVTLSNPSALAEGEVIFFGHSVDALTVNSVSTQQDLPSKLGGERLARVWAVDYKTEATTQTLDVQFDVSGLDGGNSASNYALLVDASGAGIFSDADVIIPSSLINGVLTFSKVKLTNKTKFTLAKNIDGDIDGDGVSNSAECSTSSCSDSDGDGVPDYLESTIVDTDADGIPNHKDADDDGDSIPTKNEIATQLNSAGTALSPANTDGDAIADYLDSDDDADGISTKNEVGTNPASPLDTNTDGTYDYLQKTVDGSRGLGGSGGSVVKTGKGGSMQAVSLLFLLGLVVVRRRAQIAKGMQWYLMPLALVAVPQASADEGVVLSPIYLGGNLGSSYLKPDVTDSDYENESNSDVGFGLFAGYQLMPSVAVQFNYNQLGQSGLLNTTNQQKGNIDYQTWSIDGRKTFWHSDRWSAFAGAGFNYLQNSSSTVSYEKSSTIQVKLLAGADYALQSGLYLRPQVERFSGDASYFSLGLVKHLNAQQKKIPAKEISTPPAQVEQAPVATPMPEPVKAVVVIPPQDTDKDGLLDAVDQCPNTAPRLKIDAKGCAVFDHAFPNVVFDNNSSRLTPDSLKVLDGLIPEINALASTRLIEVQAYTDNVGEEGYNVWLSDRRAKAIMSYLVSRGISADRLTAKGYGAVNPVADNTKEEGRAQNRRAVFKVTN